MTDTARLEQVIAAAHAGGCAAMRHYDGDLQVELKADASPVTAADLAAHHAIVAALRAFDPATAIVSEEGDAPAEAGDCWIVDPLDGTKEFIKRTGEFTVNIALIRESEPVLGVVYAPAIDTTYAAARGLGAWKWTGVSPRESIQARVEAARPYRMVVSRDHSGAPERDVALRLAALEVAMGSSLKFCAIADGTADFYPRFAGTMEWDTAAAQCIVECAGGTVTDREGHPLRYGKAERRNPPLFTWADPRLFALALSHAPAPTGSTPATNRQ
jgi:3'(2'), 5'-bisphosphate nucleotidase